MATKKKRITISLDNEQSELIEKASEILNKPQSAIVSDIIKESALQLKTTIEALEQYKSGQIGRYKLVASILETGLKNIGESQADLIESLGDGKKDP